MSDNGNEDNLIDKEALSGLDKKDKARISMLNLMGVLIGLVALMIAHNLYSIYTMATDNSIPLVMCPKSFYNDRPIVLKTLDKADKVDVDNMIKGFSLNFVMRLFPRTAEDAEPFYKYIANHTEGVLKKKYEARIDSIKKIKNSIEVGNYSKLYIADSQDIKIRKLANKNGWKVILKGYLHKRKIGRMEKTQPKIELDIKYVGATRENPEGFIVEDYVIRHIVDPISGEVIEL